MRSLSARLLRGGGGGGGGGGVHGVHGVRGVAARLERAAGAGAWRVALGGGGGGDADAEGACSPAAAAAAAAAGAGGGRALFAETVILATGSHPRLFPPGAAPHEAAAARARAAPAALLPLDTALSPAALAAAVGPADAVAVVGASHSAVLALRNLADLPPGRRPARIVNLFRSPLAYAEARDDEHGQWILRDNTGTARALARALARSSRWGREGLRTGCSVRAAATAAPRARAHAGLKGLAAEWARAHLEPGREGSVPGLTRVLLPRGGPAEAAAYDAALAGVTRVCYAVGFERNALPAIAFAGREVAGPGASGSGASIGHDVASGQLLARGGAGGGGDVRLPGLFGFGIAFPELWTDPHGNREASVGMWKFMRYMTRALPAAVRGGGGGGGGAAAGEAAAAGGAAAAPRAAVAVGAAAA